MKRITLAVLLLTTGLTGAPAATQGPQTAEKVPYVVRYLVFQHLGYWDDPLDSPGPEGGGEASTGSGTQLADDDQSLKPLWDKLAASSRYRPLLRGTAVPFAKPRDQAEPIPVDGQWPASIRPPFAAMNGPADRPLRLIMGHGWAPPALDGEWGRDTLGGSLTFHKGRYAHLRVDLVFTEAQRWMPWGLDRRHYFLRQSRRILPNRTYYFDHPRFGVVARIEAMSE